MKYKCLEPDCDRIFEGDRSTMSCPFCGSENIKKAGAPMPKWLIYILIALGALLAIWAIAAILPPSIITAELHPDEALGYVVVNIDGENETTLRSDYDIVVEDENGELFNILHFDGKSASVAQQISTLREETRYYFKFVKKNNDPISNFQWANNRNWYERPASPKRPVIEFSKSADCKTGKFTITVIVKEGYPDRFYLDGISQTSLTFDNVLPKEGKYILRAEDTTNHLFSEEVEVYCSSSETREFRVTEETVQRVFDEIAQGKKNKLAVGDAMRKISQGGRDISLSSPIDNCKTVEDALNYARSQQIRYRVNVTIESRDCTDVITRITLSK